MPIDLSAGWRVTFAPPGPAGAAAAAEWPTLRSWTDEEETRYFSGVATYEKSVDVPAAFLKAAPAVTFDLVMLTGWAPDPSQPKPLKPGSATHSLSKAVTGR